MNHIWDIRSRNEQNKMFLINLSIKIKCVYGMCRFVLEQQLGTKDKWNDKKQTMNTMFVHVFRISVPTSSIT